MLDALIADDEPLARRRLRQLLTPLAESGRVQIVAEAADGADVLEALRTHAIDLLFLDIRMPEMDGFGVIEHLSAENPPEVIFTTAYDQYALRAFEANAIDYLLKPIAKDRLDEAVARVERIRQKPAFQQKTSERLAELLDWLDAQKAQTEEAFSEPPAGGYPGQLSISYSDRIRFVSVDRIVSIEIEEGVTRLFALEEDEPNAGLRHHVIDHTLDHLESILNPEAFMRVHRSAIVQLRHIQEMIPWFSGRYKLVLSQGHEVIASRERSKRLKDRLVL